MKGECCMKKFALRAIAVVVGLIVLNVALRHGGFDLGSHFCTALSKMARKAQKQVPVQWEIDRLRNELVQIEPDIHRSFSDIAEEEVKVERLKKEVADGHVKLEAKKTELMTMKADLEKGTEFISYGGRKHSAEAVRTKLTHDFDIYKIADAALKNKEQLLEKKEEGLAAAKQRLEEMRAAKVQLETALEKAQTEYHLVQIAQTQSKTPVVDDSRLERIKASLNEVNDRIEAQKKTLALEQQFLGDKIIDVTSKVKGNEVLSDMDKYFGKNGDEKVVEQK
jgi:chromosome segregation ATPase